MRERDATSLSKFLSLVLRHEPGSVGITLREDGWTSVEALLAALSRHGTPLTRAELERLVRESDKQRFALSEDGAMIRASQGHSVKVELGYAPVPPPARLFHGTVARSVAAILRDGLMKGKRHHVHLSSTPELARLVGKRRGAPVVLTVDSAAMAVDGHLFYRAPNGVWLTEHVPARFLALPEAG